MCRNPSRAGALAALLLAGCGPTYHPVAGVVRLDGQPLADAAVLFEPVAGGPPAHAVTGPDGRFELEAAGRRGVLPGEYRVAVSKQRVLNVKADETVGLGGVRVESVVAERYGKPATSGLTATVPAPAYDLAVTAK